MEQIEEEPKKEFEERLDKELLSKELGIRLLDLLNIEKGIRNI